MLEIKAGSKTGVEHLPSHLGGPPQRDVVTGEERRGEACGVNRLSTFLFFSFFFLVQRRSLLKKCKVKTLQDMKFFFLS